MPTGDPITGEVWTTEGQQCRIYRDGYIVVVFHDTNPNPMRVPLEAFNYSARYSALASVPCDLFGSTVSAMVQRDRAYARYALERWVGDNRRYPVVMEASGLILRLLVDDTLLIDVEIQVWASLQNIVSMLNLDLNVLRHFRVLPDVRGAIQHPEDVRLPINPRVLAALLHISKDLPEGAFTDALSLPYRAAWRQAMLNRAQLNEQEPPTLWDRLEAEALSG